MTEPVKEINADMHIEKELRKFNLGAACFGWLWSIVNRCFKKWFIENLILAVSLTISLYGIYFIICHINPTYAFVMIPFLFVIPIFIIVILFIYSGIKGNRWAWASFKNKNIDEYKYIQSSWKTASIVTLTICIISTALQIMLPIIALKNLSTNEPEITSSNTKQIEEKEEENYICANDCKMLKEELSIAIKSASNDGSWLDNVSEELKKSDNVAYAYAFSYTETLNMTLKTNEDPLTLGNTIKLKIRHNAPCSLEEKNCNIFANAKNDNEYCLLFFDDNGNIEASPLTSKFIDKTEVTPGSTQTPTTP